MNFVEAIKKESSKTLTENGAIGYSTTYNALVDFNFRIPSYRKDKETMQKDFLKVLLEGDPYALKYLFYLRDCRKGLGERDAFRRCLVEALRHVQLEPEVLEHVIFMIPVYGRFDDLLCLFNTEFESIAMNIIVEQLALDCTLMEENKPVSLLAKWLPSDKASSKTSRFYAHKIARAMHISPRTYRTILLALRKYLDVLEIKTCANRWDEIDYNKVPSKANLRYKRAFMRHDSERREAYLEALARGDNKVKIHSATNFPHDVVHQYTKGALSPLYSSNFLDCLKYDEAIEQLWKNLPDMPGLDNTLVIRDGSGSMLQPVGNTNVTALDVADALTIYCGARCKGSYENTFITFSSRPKVVSLRGETSLRDKLVYMRTHYTECSNTNLEATFDLILRAAKTENMAQEDLPRQLLIISDMEFDAALDYQDVLLEDIAKKFAAAGYKLPKLIFWNVNSRTNTIPMTQNENGVILVSGFSVNIIKQVLSGKTSPRDALIDVLNADTYAEIPLLDAKNFTRL